MKTLSGYMKYLPLYLLLFSAGLSASVEVEGLYWSPEQTGPGQVTGDLSGSDIDFTEEFGYDSPPYAEIRLFIHNRTHSSFRVSAGTLSFENRQVLSDSLNFGGQTYTQGSEVSAGLDLEYYRAGWHWRFISEDDQVLRLGAIVELKSVTMKSSLGNTTFRGVPDSSQELSSILPTVGFSFGLQPSPTIGFHSEFTIFRGGSMGSILDSEAVIKINPSRHVSFSGGYRYLEVELLENSDYLDIEMSGPYFTFGVQF